MASKAKTGPPQRRRTLKFGRDAPHPADPEVNGVSATAAGEDSGSSRRGATASVRRIGFW
jgi:hypothetical protein